MDRQLLTVGEAADVLGISRNTVYGLIRDGLLYSVKLGRCRRVPVSAVREFLTSLSVVA